MYKQLAAWLFHGISLDKQKEFFIQKIDGSAPTILSTQIEDDELGLGGITGRQLELMLVRIL